MPNVTGPAIRNQTTIYTLVILVALYGAIAYLNLPKQQDPGFTIRAAVVTTRFPGASPLRVEQLVTDKIEQAIQEIPELDNVTSESRPGFSFITANFKESYTDMRPIFDNLRRKVEAVRGLPDGIRPPAVNDEYGDVFGSVYALTGNGFSHSELKTIAEEIRDELLHLDDVAKVTLQGIQEEEIFVEYDVARLQEIGLSPQQLSQILAGINIIRGGGEVLTGRERISLEPSGNFESVDDLRRTVIQVPGSERIVYLEDIVDITRDYVDPPASLARFNGEDAVIISVSLRDGGNILELGKTLDAEIPRIEAAYPLGIAITPVYLESRVVDAGVSSFRSNLLQAIGIVVIVMLVFLGLRTGLIVGMLVPTTILATFAVMSVLGITINQISLAAPHHLPGPAGGQCHRHCRVHPGTPGAGRERSRCRGRRGARDGRTVVDFLTDHRRRFSAHLPGGIRRGGIHGGHIQGGQHCAPVLLVTGAFIHTVTDYRIPARPQR